MAEKKLSSKPLPPIEKLDAMEAMKPYNPYGIPTKMVGKINELVDAYKQVADRLNRG